jgi:hypothetical protein
MIAAMRLWSLHPGYLDAQGLVALWRETLLAKAVLQGKTRGYRHHPQLERFKAHDSPRLAINAYLHAIHAEAASRGYAFDARKIGPVRPVARMVVTSGQLAHEWQHLLRKLSKRSPAAYERWRGLPGPEHHPLFRKRAGAVASWERA